MIKKKITKNTLFLTLTPNISSGGSFHSSGQGPYMSYDAQRCESNHGLFENPNIKSNKNTVKSPFQIVCIKSELRPFDIVC